MRLAPRLSPEPLYVFENNGENGIHLRLRAIVSWLNPTCNCCVRFATTVASGHATLAAKGYSLLGPDFHRLDRTSLRLAHLFDHLVGDCYHVRRDGETKRLRSLQIDDKLEFGGPFDGEVYRPCAFQNLVNVTGGAPV